MHIILWGEIKLKIEIAISIIILLLLLNNTCLSGNATYVKRNLTKCDVTIQGGIGLTIIIICEGEMDHSLNWSVNLDGFFILVIWLSTTYETLPDGRTEIMARILPIGFMSLYVQVLIDGEVVEEADGQMIGFFCFLDKFMQKH